MKQKSVWVCDKCNTGYTDYITKCPSCDHSIAKLVPESLIQQYKDNLSGFVHKMAVKLATSEVKGRSGWQACTGQVLSDMLREHVEKGDPIDVANFCFMLSDMGMGIAQPPAASYPCWSCYKPVTEEQRAAADGNCPHCRVEMDNWPPIGQQTVQQLRDSDHVVIIWNPEEIGEADPDHLVDLVMQRAANYLEDFQEPDDE